MKTITDAVNKFKGELGVGVPHVICNIVGDATHWSDDTPITLLGRFWSIVCTNAEFYAHVKQLTGCPIKLKQWQDSKMNKTIKDAYEDLKGVLPYGYTDQEFLFIDTVEGRYLALHARHHGDKYMYVCTVSEFLDYKKPKEEVKPVYTKAMQDAGEQIKVGMKFRTEAGEYIAELVNDLSVCFTDEFGFFVGASIHVAKGIDTRTDKEKAIDELLKEHREEFPFDNADMVASMAYDKWVK